MGSHSLLQGIFSTQGMNPGLLHCRQILLYLNHQGSLLYYFLGFLCIRPRTDGASLVAQTAKHLSAVQKTSVQSLGWEDPLEKGNGSPLQYSCLENSMDRGAWWATIHGVAKSGTRLSDFTFTFTMDR